ncbi:YdcF family protein [Williamsia sp.]|uniref:YdcF family protein n=1 Tax=Williamsia sp. TaxID=1872085 RepID=UPI001A31DCDD|nr:YdcF family protein [Williamsia sp.]MBJ7291297.1 YdcF family protein [Williamsia sp.]
MVRAVRRVVLSAIALIVVIGLAGVPVYVVPAVADTPREVDVIMVLGGRQDGRENYAISLAEKGLAPVVLVSDPYERPDAYMEAICDVPHRVKVICFDPDPRTTRGEARFLRDQAAANRWTSAMVVTFTPHVSRADYIVRRCFTGDLVMADYAPDLSLPYWAYMYLYQSAGFVRAFAQSGC